MEVAQILSSDAIAISDEVRSKKIALETLSALIAAQRPDLSSVNVFNSLIARERLGSTGVGRGVAIPHGRAEFQGHAYGAFLVVPGGIDFDAADNQPVDLFFSLLVPSEACDEHLHTLAKLAEMFSDSALLERIRAADNTGDVYRLLTTWERGA